MENKETSAYKKSNNNIQQRQKQRGGKGENLEVIIVNNQA